ncbi:MAG: hypothetical protein IKZ39_03785 [Lachnospiraceae bacterium]|nr:hypothetical protein [Lachnospiraceae bacterium]
MENNNLKNIKKAAHITSKVLGVIQGILTAGAVLCLIGAICCFLLKFDENGKQVVFAGNGFNVYSPVDMGSWDIHSFEFIEDLNIANPGLEAALNCVVAFFMVLITLIIIVIIKGAFKTIEASDTPFTKEVASKIKITGILITILVISESIGVAAVVALTFWCIYCIFEYGIELQQHEDETL